MKFAEVAENVGRLVENPPGRDEFIYDFLLAYGSPKASVTRLKQGRLNLSKTPGEVLWKNKIYFKSVESALLAGIEGLKAAKATRTNKPRFLMVTDFDQILAIDTKTGQTLDIAFSALETHFDFFIPLTPGLDKHALPNESAADVKAAEKMAKLFDAIKQDNPDYIREDAHAMNVFLSRLLFCLFAEDTGIFPENAVCNAIKSYTAEDGSDLDVFFKQVFDLLDTPENERGNIAEHLRCFPYVNGGLFRDHFDIPAFSARSRRMIIDSGSLNWSEINPDIFGSMFQAVIDPEERHNLGQHYTSVVNIMKVIEPLFLNELYAEFEKARNLVQKNVRSKALHELLDRIAKIKIFDPACGSGNFLIIAYKELRKLEMEIFDALNAFPVSQITVDQFYGIEIADFACETAVLALWLAEHQMNLEYEKRFGQSLTSLPLRDGANIVCENAARKDWKEVCPRNDGDEIYILGNPPYLGARVQAKKHKADIAAVFGKLKCANSLDYISCWLSKAADYIRGTHARFAFVSTNSICQGEQVALLWPHVLKDDLEIGFAHQSFKWSNNAKGSAGVTCVVVGVRNASKQPKQLFHGKHVADVQNINAYLVAADNVFVGRRGSPLSSIPPMKIGNKPIDGGYYLFTPAEKDKFINREPGASAYFRRWYGSQEFLKGTERWCLFVQDIPAEELGIGRPEVWAKNLVPNINTLMRAFVVVVRQPLPIDVIKLVKAHTEKVVQALSLNLSDVALAIPIGHGRLNRCPDAFNVLALPERPESFAVFGIPVMNQIFDLNAQIMKPHRRIPGLLKHPFLIGIKRCRTHENPAASEVDKYEYIGIDPSAPGKDGFRKKIGRGQCFHMGTDKQLPMARRAASTFFRDRMMPGTFKNVPDGRKADFYAQLLQLTMQVLVAPCKVFGSKPKNKVCSSLSCSRSTRFSALFLPGVQPATVGRRFDDQQYVRDPMIQQRTQPHQVGPLFLGRNNLGIVDAVPQHPDLIFQHLESGIVTWHEKPRQKNENHVKHTRKTVHIRLSPIGLILLSIKGLRGGIRFRTPRKLKESENLPKHRVSSHPKAGSGAGKNRREWLGLENCSSSLFHPERTPGWMTHPRCENRVDLTRFRTLLLQALVVTELNFQDSRFALLS